MKQVTKFYLSSFLKNQTYFVPVMILFFQNLGLSYSEIFWIFTIGSFFSFVVEIPTGIFADIYGKRKSIIISKLVIFISFVAFGLSFNFWSLLLANLIYEFGKSFRSGTETAFVYDYLFENKNNPSYAYVKANQKFYARTSEAIGTALGGFIASLFGFGLVFLLAALPAFINFIQSLTWEYIKETEEKQNIGESFLIAKNSIIEVFKSKYVRSVALNIAFFSSALFALDKFIQPYMENAGIEIKYFGIIYSAFLLMAAFAAKYGTKLEEKFGSAKVMNIVTIVAFLAILTIGLGNYYFWGVGLFFFVIMAENVRSPIANDLFHRNISSKNRATMGSILELLKSSSKLIVLPIVGYFADIYSMNFAILFIAVLVLVVLLMFWISKKDDRTEVAFQN